MDLWRIYILECEYIPILMTANGRHGGWFGPLFFGHFDVLYLLFDMITQVDIMTYFTYFLTS